MRSLLIFLAGVLCESTASTNTELGKTQRKTVKVVAMQDVFGYTFSSINETDEGVNHGLQLSYSR